MRKIKAFIFSGNQHQYQCFISENHLHRDEYPRLNIENWRGIRGNIDIIRIGTYFDNIEILHILPHIEFYLKQGVANGTA